MYCKKCKREIPSNAKFCGYCGHPVHKGKRTSLIFIAVLLLLISAALLTFLWWIPRYKEAEKMKQAFESGDMETINRLIFSWETKDLEDESTDGLNMLFERTSVSVEKVGINFITFVVTAPDMTDCNDIYTAETQDDFETTFAEHIRTTDEKEFIVSVPYKKQRGNVAIDYQTSEFINSITGGFLESYKTHYKKALDELREQVNE